MKKSSKSVVCKNCNTPMPGEANVCPSCGAKVTKPFYKRGAIIALAVIVVIVAITSIGNRNGGEKFKWSELALAGVLPEPKSNVGEIISDSEDTLSMYLHKTSEDEYENYREECQGLGFSVGEEAVTDTTYHAYNEAGYELYLQYDNGNEKLYINLTAPVEMGTLQWPTSDIAKLIPVPRSTVGTISWESSDGFFIYVGETTKDDYAAYVDECAARGFSVDYNKGDAHYYADNADGYRLSLNHTANDVMTIRIEKISEGSSVFGVDDSSAAKDGNESAGEQSSAAQGTGDLIDGMRPEFKAAMDSYEAFIDEYVAFMQKYAASNGNSPTLIADYASYLDKYAKMVADFEKWDDEDLNAAETAYYVEVETRVAQKLVGVAGSLS